MTSVLLMTAMRFVAAPQLQFVHRIASDDGRQHLIADSQPHLGEQALAPYLLDDAVELVAAAQRDNRSVVRGGSGRQLAAGGGEQALDLGLGDAVVPSGRRPGADDPLVNPLLDRGVADAEACGGFPGCYEHHTKESY